MNATQIRGLKCWTIVGLLGFSSILCYAEIPAGNRNTYDSFDQLVSEYNETIAAQRNELQAREDKFLENYRKRLEGFKGKYLQDGNLDGYVEAKKLLENFDRQRRIETRAKQRGLVEYIQESLDTDASIKADYQKVILTIRTAYINKCITLKREFTKRGKIEDAISVSRFLDKLNSETQQEQNSIARNELIKLFDNVTSPDASVLVAVFKKNVRESSLAEASFKYTSRELRDNYSRRLELLDKRYQAKGNIDGLLALNKELARHNNSEELGKTDIVTQPKELQSLQQKYFKSLSDTARKLKVDISNADKMLLASLYKAMSTDAYRKDDLFKQAVDMAIEEFQNLKTASGESGSLEMSTLEEGLVAYYPFNGNANDKSGKGNHGRVYGATLTTDRAGTHNSAYSFNGNGNYIRIPQSSSLNNLQTATISYWVRYYKPTSGNGNVATTICNGRDAASEDGFFSYAMAHSIMSLLGRVGSAQGVHHPFDATQPLTNQKYSHIVLVVDELWMRAFKNGVLVNKTERLGRSISRPSYDWLIGQSGQVPHYWLTGMMDDIRIYNRALSDPEIEQLYLMEEGNE